MTTMTKSLRAALAAALLAFPSLALAAVSISSPENGATILAAAPARVAVIGTAAALAPVTVAVNGSAAGSATADASGNWETEVSLASGTSSVEAKSGGDSAKVSVVVAAPGSSDSDTLKDRVKLAFQNPAAGADYNISDLDTDGVDGLGETKGGNSSRAKDLLDAGLKHDKMFGAGDGGLELGEKGVFNLMVRGARDFKNAMLVITSFVLLMAVVRLIYSDNSEEDAGKLKSTALWATLGIVVMVSSWAYVQNLYGKDIDAELARDISSNVFGPLTRMLEVLASFAFVVSGFYGFYKMITAHGEDEGAEKGKKTFINAVIGFLALKLVKPFVYSLYGQEQCKSGGIFGIDIFKNCELARNVGDTVGLAAKVIDWVNGFVAVVTVLMIIYAGFLYVTSGGDDDKTKQAKTIMKYAAIGMLLLVSTYVLFRFFVTQDAPATASGWLNGSGTVNP